MNGPLGNTLLYKNDCLVNRQLNKPMSVKLIKSRVGIIGWALTNYLPNCQNMHAIEKDFDPMLGRGEL